MHFNIFICSMHISGYHKGISQKIKSENVSSVIFLSEKRESGWQTLQMQAN